MFNMTIFRTEGNNFVDYDIRSFYIMKFSPTMFLCSYYNIFKTENDETTMCVGKKKYELYLLPHIHFLISWLVYKIKKNSFEKGLNRTNGLHDDLNNDKGVTLADLSNRSKHFE